MTVVPVVVVVAVAVVHTAGLEAEAVGVAGVVARTRPVVAVRTRVVERRTVAVASRGEKDGFVIIHTSSQLPIHAVPRSPCPFATVN